MLKNINTKKLAEAIQQTYKTMNEVSSANLAAEIVAALDERLEGALLAWIEGKEIPDVSHEKYSISDILSCRNSQDYLMAIRMLSDYIKDPIAGENQIWKPFHGRR